jgi:hypothetical protein
LRIAELDFFLESFPQLCNVYNLLVCEIGRLGTALNPVELQIVGSGDERLRGVVEFFDGGIE